VTDGVGLTGRKGGTAKRTDNTKNPKKKIEERAACSKTRVQPDNPLGGDLGKKEGRWGP